MSVRPLDLGSSLTQSTEANKPVLRRGLVNLLTYSHDLTRAAWASLTGFVKTLEPSAGPNGTAATQLTATATPSAPVGSGIVATSAAHTYAYVYKAGTFHGGPAMLIRNDTTSTSLPCTTTTVSLGSGWVLSCCSATSGMSPGNILRIYFGSTGAITNGLTYQTAYAGFFEGILTAQQIVDAGDTLYDYGTSKRNQRVG